MTSHDPLFPRPHHLPYLPAPPKRRPHPLMKSHPVSPICSRPFLQAAALTLALGLVAFGRAAADDAKCWLLVTNKADQTLSYVDPAPNKQVATVPEDGKTCHELIATPDGKRAFLPIYG